MEITNKETTQEKVTPVSEEVNMYDTPLEVYQACFPHDTKPQQAVDIFSLRIYGAYVNLNGVKDVNEARQLAITKSGLGGYELDILVKYLIEQAFTNEVEEKTQQSWETIINLDEDSEAMSEAFITEEAMFGQRVNFSPEEIDDATLWKIKAIVLR